MEVLMSATTDSRAAAHSLMLDYFNRELEQVSKDEAWIQDNVSDPDKREKRLSYQSWKRQQILTMIAFLGLLQ
jgi:hypothetical protein